MWRDGGWVAGCNVVSQTRKHQALERRPDKLVRRKPAADDGFHAKELLRHAQPTNSAFPSPTLFVDGDVLGTKIFRTHTLMDTLASVKRRKAKRATWGSVAEELQAMLLCVSLFTGACANRVPCGGPVKANIVIKPMHVVQTP